MIHGLSSESLNLYYHSFKSVCQIRFGPAVRMQDAMLFHTLYEGDHSDTWEPFQIVRLEEIVSTSREMYIRVRKMYRPHDTHWTHEEARTKPLTVLYWSDEILRMFPKEVANATGNVSNTFHE